MALHFEWDPAKADANLRKHGVSFEEAATIFRDPLSRLLDDPEHSEDEMRFVLFGRSEDDRMLAVMHVERHSRIRILSARGMTPKERKQYAEFNTR